MSLNDQIVNDLDVFISDDDFAVEALWQHRGGMPVPVIGIWDDAYKRIDLNTGVESSGIVFTAKSADLPEVDNEDNIIKDSVTYNIIGIEPDGTGITILRLSGD